MSEHVGHTLRLYNTLLNDLEYPLMLADIPSSQISSVETCIHTHTYSFPNYRALRDGTLKQHFSVWLKKRSFSPFRGQTDRKKQNRKCSEYRFDDAKHIYESFNCPH